MAAKKHYYPYGMLLEGNRLLAGATAAGTQTELVEENVQYTDLSLVVDDNGDLQLTDKATSGGWFYGAISEQKIKNNEYIEFEIANTPISDNYYFVGLSYSETDYNNNAIDYAFYVRPYGDLRIHSNDTLLTSTSYSIGDKLKIKRDNGTIRFYRNGVQIYTLTDNNALATTITDISMYRSVAGTGSKIFNLVAGKYLGLSLIVEPVIYTGLSGAQVDAYGDLSLGPLNATGPTKYGASSVQTVESGEYIEFEIPNTPIADNYFFVGLSYQNLSNNFSAIDYCWYPSFGTAGAIIYEQGTSVYNVAYTQGDLFRIARTGNNIVYSKNGVALRTVADANPSASMVVDITLGKYYSYQQGCKVQNLVVGKWKTTNVYSSSDYVPSHGSLGDYRYGFQGHEKDDEVKGEGNSLNFGARILDPRIGKWFSRDQVVKHHLSPYQFASNNPAIFIDPDGNDEIWFILQKINNDGVLEYKVTWEYVSTKSETVSLEYSPRVR